MYGHSWDKLIAISWALAAAGFVACAGALLDAFVPRNSLLGFLTWMVGLGIVAVGSAAGYAWICDRCGRSFEQRIDRLMAGRRLNRDDGTASISTTEAKAPLGERGRNHDSQPSTPPSVRGRQAVMPPGAIPRSAASQGVARHAWQR